MDEGVDPTQMCQSLVDKVARSKQLSSVVEPEVLALFESWLEELEEEVISVVRKTGPPEPSALAEALGLSQAGAMFFITKLIKEGKI
jgi:hypothetical protein